MTGDNDAVWGKVKTSIPLVLRGVTEEDTPGRAWSELVGSDGREVGVAGTPEDTKVHIGGGGAKEGKVRRGGGDCFGREEVEEIGGGVKALNPVAGWKRRMEQGAHDIVGGANHALDLAILRGGVGYRTGHCGWCNQTAWKRRRRSERGWRKCQIWGAAEKSRSNEYNHQG
jgi:hypothetical protein